MIKIAITGPESTGKSQLSKELAGKYQTVFVPEYAREYIDKLDRPYNRTDILEIAKGQIRNEQEIAKDAQGIVFSDTELIVTKIWSEVKYGICDPWILEMIIKNKYDYYLLCNIDLPWEADPQREHPDRRQELFTLYFKELAQRNVSFDVVSGFGRERMINATNLVDYFLQKVHYR